MLSALKKRWMAWQAKNTDSSASSNGDIHAHLMDLEDADIPRYPPFAKGLPATPIDKLLATQRQLIARIHQSLGFSREDGERLLFPVIRNYAAFVHLLPASEAHHHRGAGGLFRHGLEVAFWATQASEAIIFEPEGSPEEKIEKEPRWRFGVFLGALMHDLGKPLSDVVVTDKPGKLEWNPYAETLEQWLQETSITHYFLRWNKGRHQRHERLATLALNMVMTPEVNRYLRLPGPELMKTLIEAISGTSALHPMAKLIMLADSESVKRDLKESRLSVDGTSLGVSIEPYIIDAIRSLVQSGRWKTNQMDAQVWHFPQGTFIAWRQAVPSLVQKLKDNSVPAVPHDPDTLADYLIDRGFALPRPIPGREDEADEHYFRYWEVTVKLEAEEGLTVEPTILMLRMEDSFLVFGNATNPPEELEATIPGLDADGQLIATQESGETAQEGEQANTGEEDDAEEESDGEQPPSSVRARLLSFQAAGDGDSENVLAALDALSADAFGSGASETSNTIVSRNTDNTVITVGGSEEPDAEQSATASNKLTGNSASITGIDALDLLTPKSNKPSPKKSTTSSNEKGIADADLGNLLGTNKRKPATPTPVKSTSAATEKRAALDNDSLAALIGSDAAQKKAIQSNKGNGALTPAVATPSPKVASEGSAGLTQAAVVKRPSSKAVAPEPVSPVNDEEHDALDDSESVLATLAELSSAMGADMGMDLPFELPEATSSGTETDEDDDIQYESLETDGADVAATTEQPTVNEAPNVAPLVDTAHEITADVSPVESVSSPMPGESTQAPVVAVTDEARGNAVPKQDAKKPKHKRRKRAANSPQSETATPDMFAANEVNKASEKKGSEAVPAAGGSNDWLAHLTGLAPAQTPSPTVKAAKTPVNKQGSDFDFLMGAGAQKHSRNKAKTTLPTPDPTTVPATREPATTDDNSTTVEPESVKVLVEVEIPASPTNEPIESAANSLFDIGMPDFGSEPEPDNTSTAEVVDADNVESLEGELPGVSLVLDEPQCQEQGDPVLDAGTADRGDLPPVDCYDDMPPMDDDDDMHPVEDDYTPSNQDVTNTSPNKPTAHSEQSDDSTGEDLAPLTVIPITAGNDLAEQVANQYLSDVLAPILKGYGLLGQVLLREPPHLVLLVDAACQLLDVERGVLIPALVNGGAVLGTDVSSSIEKLVLAPATGRWVERLLREREAERLNDIAMAEESDNATRRADEKPTTSIVRRKTRSSLTDNAPTSLLAETFKAASTESSSRKDAWASSPSVLNGPTTDQDEDSTDDSEDEEHVPSPRASLSAHDALSRLRSMILAGEGEWLAGSVSKEGEGFSTSDLCLEKVVKDNPELSRAMLRNALRASTDLKMAVVAKNKRIFVKD